MYKPHLCDWYWKDFTNTLKIRVHIILFFTAFVIKENNYLIDKCYTHGFN